MLNRAVLGFVAAAIAVLTFHQAVWTVFWLAGQIPLAPYPMLATQPLGVPLILSLCFWGGLYGAAFGLAMPSLRGPLWLWGIGLGLLAAAVGLVIVPGLKGHPVNLAPAFVLGSVLINGFWGFGVGLIAPVLIQRRWASATA